MFLFVCFFLLITSTFGLPKPEENETSKDIINYDEKKLKDENVEEESVRKLSNNDEDHVKNGETLKTFFQNKFPTKDVNVKPVVIYEQPPLLFEPLYTDLGFHAIQREPVFLPVIQEEFYPYKILPVTDIYSPVQYATANPELTERITIKTFEPANYQILQNHHRGDVIVQFEHNLVKNGQNLPENQRHLIYYHQYPEYV